MTPTATLSIVATPIGNLEDITLRALRTLKECDVIYAEDTRVISKLLARYEIQKPLQRLDAATEATKADEIIGRLCAGEHVVYVSDAGTPGVSDPGQRLVAAVRSCIAAGEAGREIHIEAIPGASALTALISIAGLETTGFTFLGFLPHKKGRQTALKRIAESELPVVLYESPHRILKLLEEAAECGLSRAIVGRELTKLHEEVVSGAPAELRDYFEATPEHVRGEFVVLLVP
ncbi:16S rRNA (cytidine(1402)-2'-O)-methyltransferase [Candidatus Kaiserbacteria bacterium CG10_big_fil_rev_8_21_14_0_10_56_12]|uniref:Ribosomal RNA small subunit methyltransferase I n=1 Tax=Candidatus Kaiserbacteria bacterium CG10_big_fil_rev_8_21_14_0_10_56_12 TaxID=1974611 RepID=A0A2H0UCP7_9BACT|nr:MAG: 16S rRNA (cytidine(1402)-2'-O)-methyltransferase [Candidatus Kaiserbacteria bacterium CG10_big_fil_rev_8_21_14_0_10_56_12]